MEIIPFPNVTLGGNGLLLLLSRPGLHLFLASPALKPGDAVFPRAVEDIPSVHALVVIKKNYVTLSHLHKLDVFHGNIVHVLQVRVADVAVVAVEHVRLVDLGGSIFEPLCSVGRLPVLPELGRVRVDIAEPVGLARDGMNQYRRLRRSTRLQHLHRVVPSLAPLEVDAKVYLGVDRSGRESLQCSHDARLDELGEAVDPPEERELHNRVPNIAVVQPIDKVRLQIPEDLPSVCDQELPPGLSGLEAYERSGAGCPRADELVVHADEKILPGLLVHRLVHRGILVAVDGWPGADRVQWVEARLHAQGLVELNESGLLLHQVELPEDYGTIVHHFLLYFRRVLLDVRQLSLNIVAGQSYVRSLDRRCELDVLPRLRFFLCLCDVGYFVAPHGKGCQRRLGNA
mmetsp:Transcript_33622/g.76798  ORF Transcript_33622/g.76798 Transcript_33622/m.76798 type:complete len:401 (+) Transcript_33622:121-1323(+)